eukprot:7388000-Prymnesium_polylepis.1
MECCSAIIEACALSRAFVRGNQEGERTVRRIYRCAPSDDVSRSQLSHPALATSQCPHPLRYLGLAHCCGYIGLTPVYSHENLLEHFIQEFELLEDDPVEHKILAECSTQTGAKVYLRFVSFALSTMGNAVED